MPPSRTWLPAQEWPPDRIPIRMPASRASRTASTTSASLAARTTTSGNRSGVRAFQTVARRAGSYSASPLR